MQSAPAVDQRPHPRRADLPAGQTQLGEQRRHLGPPGDERLGADVDGLAADPLGAQHAAEAVGGSNTVIDASGPAATRNR